MKRCMIIISLLAAMLAFNASAKEKKEAVKVEGAKATLSCDKCIAKTEGAEKCAAVITIEGKSYPFKGKKVKGAKICKAEVAVTVTGEVKKGKFVASSTELAAKKAE